MDTPLPPAQTHPVLFKPANLRGLSIWAYLALGFVILSAISVGCYAVFCNYYALKLKTMNATPLPQYSVKSPYKTKRPRKKAWSSSSQQQPMLSTPSIPAVAFPETAVSPPAKPRTIPTFDMHNIRFASPSNLAIYTNPKLMPVVGSAVPLSYDSQNNLFGNLFTPTTMAIRKEKKRSISAFRGKSKSLWAGKENYKVLPGQGDATL
ncbi:hypothetical protein MSAN_01397500 [Mycena sanguinolenta]|uniref:Uncharacterized protein n=1 Tax=Mycena sanguinolenta TaxID=230812 RepID=A0A8H6YAH6_9AGAR|nr:hypothetical protein MSAN_01397500 [Mycena sanguinolenta]